MANINPQITDPDMRAMMGLSPLTGWTPRFREQQGEGATGYNAFYNWDTNTWSDIDPTTVSNPLYAIGQNQAQGEGATSTPVYANMNQTAQFEPYRSYLSQVLTGDASGMGQIEGDPNFNWSQYFEALPAGTDMSKIVPQANAGIQKLLAARPDLTIRGGPWGSGFVPWADFADFNRRSDILNPSNSVFEDFVGVVGDTAKDLWNSPIPLMAAMAATAGAVNPATAAPVTGAVEGGLAAELAAGAPELAGTMGLSSAAAGLPAVGPAVSSATSAPVIAPAAAAATNAATSGLATALGISPEMLRLLGIAGATGLGIYGADKQSDALAGIAAQSRADRAPFLNAATGYLNDPTSYAEGPGLAFMDATLKRLSAERGNPYDSPTALALATQAGLQDWRNAVTGFANLGLSGEDSRNNLMASAAGADANALNALGWGIGQATNPPTTIEQLLKQLRNQLSLA